MNTINFNPDENKVKYQLGDSDKYIEFDSGDLNFPVRIDKAISDIQTFTDSFAKEHGVTDINDIANIKSGNLDDDLNTIQVADTKIRGFLNEAFGYDVSSIAFGICNCLTVTRNGDYYFENFLKAIYPVVEDEYNVRLKTVTKRINKYTQVKGQHSK